MRADGLLTAVALILEEVCQSHYHRETGLRDHLTREEWLKFRERVDMICIMNTPKESDDGRTDE